MNFKTKIYNKAILNSDKIAVEDFDNNKKYTYLDFIKFYHSFNNCCFKNKKIGIFIDKSADYIMAVFSITLSNNSFIPIDPNLPIERIKFIISDAKIDLILTNNKFNNHSIFENNNIIKLKIEDLKLETNKDIYNHKIPFNLNKTIYTIYTSGTTGVPKGVVLTFNGIDNVISQQVKIFELNESIIYLFLSISFDASLSDIYCSFISGSTLLIAEKIKQEPDKFVSFINDNSVNYIDIPPSYLKLIDPASFKTLKSIVIGGEVANPEMIKSYSKNMKVINVYGPTEATICTSLSVCDSNWELPYIGEPLNNVIYNVFDENFNEVDIDKEGELYISGIQLAKEYTNIKITNEKFLLINNIRYYKTGDKVLYTEKGIVFLGRIDRQIKHNGQLICLEEIEQAINSIKEIESVSVVYKNNKLYAYFEGNISEEFILNKINKIIPKYMIPNYFINYKIPKTISGKNDSKALINNELYFQLYEVYSKILNLTNFDESLSFQKLGADSIDFISLQLELRELNIFLPYEYLMNNNRIIDIINFKNFKYKTKEDIVKNIKIIDKPNHIVNNTSVALVTGATGKLGTHLLNNIHDKYSKIYCLVRNHNDLSVNRFDNVVYIKISDLSDDFCGMDKITYNKLSEEVTFIYHCAGKVNNLLPFENLFDSNVKSTINILKFSFNLKVKYIYYASTLSVYVSGEHDKNAVFNEDTLILDDKILYNGYAQTKWLSDYYLTQHNYFNQIKMFRFGLLIDEENFQGHKDDFLFKLINHIKNSDNLPIDDVNLCFDYTPLNLAAKIMSDYSNIEANDIYNVSFNKKIYYNDIVNHYNIKLINKEEWFKFNHNELSMYLALMNGEYNNLNIFEMTFVEHFITSIKLKDYSFNCIISKLMI